MINRRILPTIALTGVLALGTAGAAQAKHGADDPAGHRAGDDHAQRHHKHHRHHHHGRHHDDGANHS